MNNLLLNKKNSLLLTQNHVLLIYMEMTLDVQLQQWTSNANLQIQME